MFMMLFVPAISSAVSRLGLAGTRCHVTARYDFPRKLCQPLASGQLASYPDGDSLPHYRYRNYGSPVGLRLFSRTLFDAP